MRAALSVGELERALEQIAEPEEQDAEDDQTGGQLPLHVPQYAARYLVFGLEASSGLQEFSKPTN